MECMGANREQTKGKYCDYYWSIKKTPNGYIWEIRGDWRKGSEVLVSSLINGDPDFTYYETITAARSDCYDAIQDYYR